MLNDIEKVDEIEIRSDRNFMKNITPEKIYKENSSLNINEKVINKINIFDNFLLYNLFLMLCMSAGFTISLSHPSPSIFKFLVFIFTVFSIIIMAYLTIYLIVYNNGLHPSYYIIGRDRIIKIPKNENRPNKIIDFDDIEDIRFSDGVVTFSGKAYLINLSLPNEEDFSDIQDEIYNLN